MRALHINGMTPPALAIAIALGEKRLAFEIVEHGWADTATALAQFAGDRELTNGLEGEFPILVDGDAAVSDSLFVLEYLDDRYPDPALKPADAYGQWRVQAIARFLGERALPAVSALGLAARPLDGERATALAGTELFTPERRKAWGAAADADLADAHRNAAALLDRVDGLAKEAGEWLLGPAFTLTDIAAFALLRGLTELDDAALVRHPAARAWFDRVLARPAAAEALALRPLAFLPGPELSRWG